MTIMKIKVLYYVDSDDNTKGSLIAFPSNKNLQDTETIEQIMKVLKEWNFGGEIGIAAFELAYHGYAELSCQMGNYEFGWEEIELFTEDLNVVDGCVEFEHDGVGYVETCTIPNLHEMGLKQGDDVKVLIMKKE